MENCIFCTWSNLLIVYFISAGGKGKKKKGTTMALTDFLSDEQGNVQGPGTSYVLANKTMDWAAEMEELDASK